MRFAYADPPYLGQGKLYRKHHDEANRWDDPASHKQLVDELSDSFPDGWAMSLSSPSLKIILPMCPPDVRVMAWVKPFCSFKPGINPAYAWEPVVVRGGRKRGRDLPTVRDWVSVSITLKKGLTGAKPYAFAEWIFAVLNVQPGDMLVDLFPGTNAITAALEAYRTALSEAKGRGEP